MLYNSFVNIVEQRFLVYVVTKEQCLDYEYGFHIVISDLDKNVVPCLSPKLMGIDLFRLSILIYLITTLAVFAL